MAVVLGAMGSLAPKLLQLLQSEYELQKNVRRKLKSVYEELDSIRAALNKVAAVPWDQLDEQVKVWACQVRDASYDLEDVLDTFLMRVEVGKPVNRNRLKRAMKKMGGLFGDFKARRGIAGAIDDIEKQLQEVANRRAKYKIDDIVANPAPATTVDPRLSALYIKASQLVGIDGPREELIEMLSIREDDSSSNEMKIISIDGFGGLGKTTLAKAVYDKVSPQFDCGAFVPVGHNPDPCKVLRDVLIDLINNDADKRKNTNDPDKITSIIEKSYTGADLMSLDKRQLINELRRFLHGKRYFVVVDDIWDITTWEVLKIAFADSNSRSRIIATTRNSNVAEKIGKVYTMKKLPESHSRKLLYTRTFGMEEEWPDNVELAVVSQKIICRCDGVPLAIITIGSLLAGKQIEEWPNVYDSVGFGHGDDSQVNNMKKILSFSYYDLPCHLRTCMLYLTVFPEDYRIHRDMLIWMWIAEGLVQAKQGKELFKEGESYFLELINRGMIQPAEKYGLLDGCRVHDMVLHMIRNLSRDEKFFAVQDNKQWSQGSDYVRRLALHRAELIQVNYRDMPKLRSFNAMYCGTDNIPPISIFKLLRVLSLVGCRPLDGHLDTKYLGKLLHLRYLGLLATPVRELPKEIGHLKFLQTLLLTGTGLEELPKTLRQATKLMCLRADKKTRVPDWICELTSLLELSMMGADGDRCLMKELGKLRDLRMLYARMTVQDEGEVQGFLEALSNLEKMEVIVVLRTSKHFVCKDGIMQQNFVLHCNNLRVLQLDQLNFSRLPRWINPQALPMLCMLKLNLSALYQQDVEILGKFENLGYLYLNVISGFSSKISIAGGGRFQNLMHFRVAGLYQLEFLKGAVPRLQDIWLLIAVRRIFNTYDLGLKFGLGNISVLQAVEVVLDCACCLPSEVEEVEAALRHPVSVHPSRPTIKISRTFEAQMVTSSDSVMERQKKRAQRLWSQIGHLQNVHSAMRQQVVEMGDIKTDLNSSHAKNKAEEIAAMERGLEILTVEYPRLNAMFDALRYAFSLQGAVPRPPVIALYIDVDDVMDKNISLHFGIGNHQPLQGQQVKAHIDCALCSPTEVEAVEAELRHAVHIEQHNNPPSIEIIRFREDKMVNSDSQKLERQKWRAARLRARIKHQMVLHNAMRREAVEMREQITDLNLSDDTKNKHKLLSETYDRVQQFHQLLSETYDRVQHKLLPVQEDTPTHDRDLNRLKEDNVTLEHALGILTINYPLLAAVLDELRYAFSLQGAMPMPHVINLNIRVFDIKVDKLGLDLGLLGKISSLRGIKAHLICYFCFPTEVEEVESELRQAVHMHHPNNPPTLEIIRYAEDRMVNSDSDSQMLERQTRRRTGLTNRVNYQIRLHNKLKNTVVKIVEEKTNMTLCDDAKHKEQRFLEHFDAINDRVEHELLRVNENIPYPDLKRVTEEIEDMERVLQILTVDYPRSAAMLEELKTALRFEAEDEDEVTDEDVSEASLYDTEEDEMTEDEVSGTTLSDREEDYVDDEEVSAASPDDTEGEDEISEEEEVSAASLSDRIEEDKFTEEVISAASVSETEGKEPKHLSNQ